MRYPLSKKAQRITDSYLSYTVAAIVLVLVSMFPVITHAGDLGLSPSRMHNDRLLRGSTVTQKFDISRSTIEEDASYRVSLTGDAADFIALNVDTEEELQMEAGEPSMQIIATITIPEDTRVATYTGAMLVEEIESFKSQVEKEDQASAGSLSSTLPAVVADFQLQVQQKEITEYVVDNITTLRTAVGEPISVFYSVENTGNQPAGPDSLTIDLGDITNSESVLETAVDITHAETAPFTRKLYYTAIDHELVPGNYWAHVAISDDIDDDDFTRTSSFEVFEELAFEKAGQLGEIGFEQDVVDGAVELTTTSEFQNTTSQPVPLTLIVTATEINAPEGSSPVYRGIEHVAAPPNGTVPVAHQFSIAQSGDYKVRAEVTYPAGELISNEYTLLVSPQIIRQLETIPEADRYKMLYVLAAIALIAWTVSMAVYIYLNKRHATK